jgi:preprotein translocase subunit SecA
MDESMEDLIAAYTVEKVPAADWDWPSISEGCYKVFGFHPDIPPVTMQRLTPDNFRILLREKVQDIFNAKAAEFGDEMMDHLIKVIMLQIIDSQWKDHLLSIDHLKEGIGLRGYGQKDPKQEYKKEAFQLFIDMIGRIREEVVGKIFWVQIAREEDVERIEEQQQQKKQRLVFNLTDGDAAQQPAKSKKHGRNEPCPCGSGKKYKQCHGK